jgi:hypothetical protein
VRLISSMKDAWRTQQVAAILFCHLYPRDLKQARVSDDPLTDVMPVCGSWPGCLSAHEASRLNHGGRMKWAFGKSIKHYLNGN